MVGQIYPTELQLNKTNSNTEAPFVDLILSITNGIVSSKIYDKRDAFHFEIVNFPFDLGAKLIYMGYFASLLHPPPPQEEKFGYYFQLGTCHRALETHVFF